MTPTIPPVVQSVVHGAQLSQHGRSVAHAKQALLNWAEVHDRHVSRKRSRIGAFASASVIAILGAVAVSWLLPRRHADVERSKSGGVARFLVRLALVARAGRWLLPYAAHAVARLKRGNAEQRPV